MRIGELARRAGVSTSKIRFYEARGLLPAAPRRPNGYRDYGDHALRVVHFIQRAQSFGFSLSEVAVHLRAPDDEGRKARLQARLELKLADLDAHVKDVKARRAIISNLIKEIRTARAV